MKTDVLLQNLYFRFQIHQVTFQHKIAVFDPLSCSWHAGFSIFVIIFRDATVLIFFQTSLDDLDQLFQMDDAFIP